jgi:glutamate formiminotransferase
MKTGLLAAVPNISEGRDRSLVTQIAGTKSILDVHVDPDHNRSVITLAAHTGALIATCLGVVDRALRVLDLRAQSGVHPRFGVVDVLPLVPLSVPETDAADAAAQLREGIEALGVPVYAYGRANDERRTLPQLRRLLRDVPHRAHETAGVVCLGIRDPLVAFNVNLRGDIEAARAVARAVRTPDVRALGFDLASRGLVQVSMNLVEPLRVGPREVFDRIGEVARDGGLELVDCEIVGLVPHPILEQLQSLPLRTPARSIEQALTDKRIDA